MVLKALFHDAVIENNQMYFYDNLINCICKVSLQDYSLKIISENEKQGNFIIYKIFHVKRKFYLFDLFSADITIFNEQAEKFYMVHGIKKFYKDGVSHFLYKNKIYCLPMDISEKIIVFDIDSEQLTEESSIAEMIDDIGICYKATTYKDNVYRVLKGSSLCLKYDLIRKKVNIKKYENLNLYMILQEKERVWIVDNEKLELCCVENRLTKFKLNYPVSNIVKLETVICVLFRFHNSVLFIDRKNLRMNSIILPLQKCEYERSVGGSNFHTCIEDQEFYYLLPWKSNGVIKISKDKLVASYVFFRCGDYKDFIKKKLFDNQVLLKESEMFNVKDLLVLNDDIGMSSSVIQFKGQDIWEFMQ